MTKTLHPMWRADAVEGVANAVGRTDWPGLSGQVIARRLAAAGVPDINPTANKRTRLWTALIAQQQTDQASNCIIAFISHAMAPGNHLDDPSRFTALQEALAEPLALVGLPGQRPRPARERGAAATLDEIAKLAGRLRGELSRRGVHQEVLRYCEEELIRKSIFHAAIGVRPAR